MIVNIFPSEVANRRIRCLIPAELIRVLDSSIPSRFSPLYFPKRLFQDIHSPVELTVPDYISPAELTVPDCIFPAEAAAPQSSMPDRWSRRQIHGLFPWSRISVPYRCLLPLLSRLSRRLWLPEPLSLSSAASFQCHSLPSQSLGILLFARTPCGGSFPHRVLCAVHLQQPCQGPEDGDHFPSRSPCLSLAFYPAFRIPACRIILHCILPNRVAFPFSWSITPLKNSNIRM